MIARDSRLRLKLPVLPLQHKELIALGKMGGMFWREGVVVDSCMRSPDSALIYYYYILIYKLKLPKLPTTGSAPRSAAWAGDLMGSFLRTLAAPGH